VSERRSRLRRAWRTFTTPAADPRTAYPDVYERQLELVRTVGRARAAVAETKEKLERKTALVSRELGELESQAGRALEEGRGEVARLALRHRGAAQQQLADLERILEEIERKDRRLALAEQRLAAQIETFLGREDAVAARQNAAEAELRIAKALAGVGGETVALGFALEQAEETMAEVEARAAAVERMLAEESLDLLGGEEEDAGPEAA
jgi:phage shock protein A